MDNLIISPVLGLLGMAMAYVVYMLVMKYPDGEDKVKEGITSDLELKRVLKEVD